LVSESGELLESESRQVTLDARSQSSFALSELFALSDLFSRNGYLIAELDGIRTARRVLDKAVSKVCAHNVELAAEIKGNSVMVHVTANCFIHELSLLPELVALDRVEVSAERITLLPGESIDITIDCSNATDAKKVASQIEETTWSLNRLMN
jgi:beta-mannosidase